MENRRTNGDNGASGGAGAEEKRLTLTVRVPRALARAFKVHAAAHDLKQQDILEELIKRYLREQGALQV
jgi:hypothetical protein